MDAIFLSLQTGLDPACVDFVVFCLSLMGTNYKNYLIEAHRVVEAGGWLLIAEVKNRMDPKTGGSDPDMLVKAFCDLGFTPALKDFSNKMFVLLHFNNGVRDDNWNTGVNQELTFSVFTKSNSK